MLEGKVFAARAIAGSYQLKIWQNGASSSSISQGGDFTVRRRRVELARLGVVAARR